MYQSIRKISWLVIYFMVIGIVLRRRDATVASRREISYTRLLIREHSKIKTFPGGGVSFDELHGEKFHLIATCALHVFLFDFQHLEHVCLETTMA